MKPAGRIAGDMKWHVYRYPQKPKTLMVLGSILTEPDNLESSLNYSSGIAPFPPEHRMDQTYAVQRTMRSEISKNIGGRLRAMLPVNPFLSAGGGVDANWSTGLEATVDALDIRAEIILHDTASEYVNNALKMPSVAAYVRKGLFTPQLYMIVGVATCKGLVMGDADKRGGDFSLEADADLPPAGVGAGAGVSRGNQASRGSGVQTQEECDFAYRVREFQYSRSKRAVNKGKDWAAGALFNNDGHGGLLSPTSAQMDESDDEIPEFDYFEEEDEDVEEGTIS